ncbi:MAG: hypothetical protein AAGG50_00570 [Bacteroidota bacterium]
MDDSDFEYPKVNKYNGYFDFYYHDISYIKIEGSDSYKKFIDLFSGENGVGKKRVKDGNIIIMDLGLDLPGYVMEEADSEDGSTRNEVLDRLINGAFADGNPLQRQGLYLIAKLMSNRDWHGVIQIATTLGSNTAIKKAIEKIRYIFPERDVHIQIASAGDSMRNVGKDIIRESIEIYLREFGDIEHRIWGADSRLRDVVSSWYSDGSDVPHTYILESKSPADYEKCRKEISRYLRGLFRFDPPQHWFDDAQLKILHRELQGLVGSKSIAHVGKGIDSQRRLSLGAVIIVLAAVLGSDVADALQSVNFEKGSGNVLPVQSGEQARKSIVALATMFSKMCIHDNTSSSAVNSISFDPEGGILRICLGFDCEVSYKPGQVALAEKIRSIYSIDGEQKMLYGGQSFNSYLDFVIQSSKSIQGKRSSCIVNVFPGSGMSNCGTRDTILEVRVC